MATSLALTVVMAFGGSKKVWSPGISFYASFLITVVTCHWAITTLAGLSKAELTAKKRK